MPEISLEYLAGFLDGEGCITFCKYKKHPFPLVVIANTSKEILDQIQNQFGGSIRALKATKPHHKIRWQWRIAWQPAVDFLRLVYPHLRLKQQQAQVMFEWAAARPGKNQGPWPAGVQDELVRQIHVLNRRGQPIVAGLVMTEVEQARSRHPT